MNCKIPFSEKKRKKYFRMLSAEIFTQYAKVIITQRFYMNVYVFCTITIQVLIFYKAAFSTYIVRNLYEMSEPVF